MTMRRLRNEPTLKPCSTGRNQSSIGSFVARTRMHATKSSSIKSPIAWQATLQPSNIYKALYFACLLLALIALSLCPLHWIILGLVMLITAVGGILIYLSACHTATLAWCTDESWRFDNGCTQLNGFTATGSYRSMLLIVVAIKPESGRTQYIPVWRDALTPSMYSALHIRLATTSAQQLQ